MSDSKSQDWLFKTMEQTVMADRTDSKQPRNRSRKALEYKVYWLERKLAFQLKNQEREQNAVKVESMSPASMKQLRHINNEFQRPNEQSAGLKILTEEVNSEALRINERSEPIQDFALNKIADAERSYLQSRRLQDRTQKLNKQLSQSHKQSESLNNETDYLNKLNLAQHKARDTLNHKTSTVNAEGEATKQASEHQMTQPEKVQRLGETRNKRSLKFPVQLTKNHEDFIDLKHESESMKQQTGEKFIQFGTLKDDCKDDIDRVDEVEEQAIDVIAGGEQCPTRASHPEELAQQPFEKYLLVNKASLASLYELDQGGDHLIPDTATDCLLHQASQQYHSLAGAMSVRLVTLTNGTESTLSDLIICTEMGINALTNQTLSRAGLLEDDVPFRLNLLLSKSTTNFVEVGQSFEIESNVLLTSLRSEANTTLSNTVSELDTTEVSFYLNFDQKLNQQLMDSEVQLSKSVTDLNETPINFSAEFDKQLSDELRDSEERILFSVAAMQVPSPDLIDRSESTLDLLSERAANLMSESQEFLHQTEHLNEKTQAIVEEGETLNKTSITLQNMGRETIEEADSLVLELGNLKSKLRTEVDEMLTYSAALNQQSTELNQEGETVNQHSLVAQQDSMRTQELSQEINSQSLKLQEEARRVNNAFLEINQNHETLSDKLIVLKTELEQLVIRGHDQLHTLNDSQSAGERINKVSSELNTETRTLNQQTVTIAQEAKASISKTEVLNKLSRQIAEEIQGTQQELESLHGQILSAERESLKATDAAKGVAIEGRELQQELVNASNKFKQTQLDADAELNNIQRMREETTITAEESREACSTLKQCVADSRRINDEFLRGLESANDAHQQTEQEVQTLLNETSHLQQEMTDILELKNGIGDFQANVNHCQERLDKYTNMLLSCRKETGENTEAINDYQNRLENYQADTEMFRRNLEQCELRARRLETHIREYEKRMICVESQPDSKFQEEISDQLEHIRMIESGIRQEISTKQAVVDNTLRSITQNMQKEMKLAADAMLKEVKAELSESQKVSEQKHNSDNLRVDGSLEEHQSLLKKQHQTLEKHEDTLDSHEVNLTQLGAQFEDVNHRLQNYQGLLRSEIDKNDSDQYSERLAMIEAKLENQDAMLKDKLPKPEKREAENTDENFYMADMLDRFKHAMDDAVNTNQTLKESLDVSQKVNNKLAKINIRLQKQLDEAKSNQSDSQKKFGMREERVTGSQTTPLVEEIEELKARKGDSLQTMQQLRLTMTESTRAMRETQKALEHFRHADNTAQSVQAVPPRRKKESSTWVGSAKQAVASSLFAITIMGMGIFGIDAVDASNKLTAKKTMTAAIQTPQSTFIASEFDVNNLAEVQTGLPTGHGIGRLDSESVTHDAADAFLWPVNAGVSDPSTVKYQRHHEGVNISAELGEAVLAINDGEVIYSANEIRGYGNVIVIQHKGELVSVYANNQFNYVRKGDLVERGQLIGDVGQLFNQEEAGLYFEIRYEGKAEDPFSYLGYQSEG